MPNDIIQGAKHSQVNDIIIIEKESYNRPWTKKHFENELRLVKAEFNASYDALSKVVETKERVISELNQKVGEATAEIKTLKESLNFMSQDSTDIKQEVKSIKDNHNKKLNDILRTLCKQPLEVMLKSFSDNHFTSQVCPLSRSS